VWGLYAEPDDPQRPKGNFEETSKQLLADTRAPLPARAGQPCRYDYSSEREGRRNLFLFWEPQTGWRHIAVTAHRTKVDFAHQRQWLVDERYPQAEGMRVVLDKLNTHNPASLYEALAPQEARRLAKKLAFHYTPTHGSRLNRAEIECSILARQCLARRLPDEATRKHEVLAYQVRRNAERATLDWRFSLSDARTKLHRLYPSPLVR
jgi:hypothetical protein